MIRPIMTSLRSGSSDQHLSIQSQHMHYEKTAKLYIGEEQGISNTMGREGEMSLATTWEELPDECWVVIFGRLGHYRHLEPISVVCKRFLTITNLGRTILILPSPSSSPSVPLTLYSRFPNLNSLRLRHLHPNIDGFVRDLAHSTLPLESLHLSHQTHFPLVPMRLLAHRMQDTLKSLSCTYFQFFNDADLFVIAGCFSYLERLDIRPYGSGKASRRVTDHGIRAISDKLKSLLSLCISSHDCLSEQSYRHLSSNCPLLCDLSASFALDRNVYLDHFLSDGKFASLTSLAVDRVMISDSVFLRLAKADLKLWKLILSHPRGDVVNLSSLFRFLQSCRSLRHLYLMFFNFPTDLLASDIASSIPNVEVIDLSCFSTTVTRTTLFNLLNNYPNLEEICMARNLLGNQGSIRSAVNYRVRKLVLTMCRGLSDETLVAIASVCPRLESLSVDRRPYITGRGVGAIMRCCSNMKRLNIRGCEKVKDLGLGLDVEFPTLEMLEASLTGIGDDWLSVAWRSCKNLHSLHVASSSVTVNGLEELIKNHKQLKKLYINEMFHWTLSDSALASLVFSSVALKKIFLPDSITVTKDQSDLFLSHGCLVRAGCRMELDYP